MTDRFWLYLLLLVIVCSLIVWRDRKVNGAERAKRRRLAEHADRIERQRRRYSDEHEDSGAGS